jgi:hypothetical protein
MATPAVPAPCQPLADQATTLGAQYRALVDGSKGLTGQAIWDALAKLGTLRDQVIAAEAELAQCVSTHGAAVTGTVVVIDASGGTSPTPQTVTLWDLDGGTPTAHALAPVQAGAFGLQGPLPSKAALTLQTTGRADLTGVDFRSGALPDPLTGEAPRIEIVIGPTVRIPSEELTALASTITPLSINEPAFTSTNPSPQPIALTYGGFSVALSQGAITLNGNGTIAGGILGGESPFSVSITATCTPSADPQSENLLDVALTGISSFASVLLDLLGPPVRQALSDGVNAAVSAAVVRGFALAALPVGVRVSLRSLTIDEAGISYQPALGAIGTTLSSFSGSPLPLP